MFQLTTYLPPFSNREDYLLTLSMFDDDTLLPIDLSGITLFNTGTSFTSNAWTVTDGNIITSASTIFTIPTFPITGSNYLGSLPLVVGTGLAIKPGDFVKVSDTATGLNFVYGYVSSYGSSTGALVVQIGWNFQFEIRQGGFRTVGDGYQTWWDWGVPDDLGPLLQANFTNGFLSLISNNIVQILIPAATMQTLGATSMFGTENQPGTFMAAMVGTDGINTRQFLTGKQPIYNSGTMQIPTAGSPAVTTVTVLTTDTITVLTPP